MSMLSTQNHNPFLLIPIALENCGPIISQVFVFLYFIGCKGVYQNT